jgi:sec-independent protein translocase protein TatA
MIEDLLRPQHLLVIALIAILFFGPKKLPELGKGLAQGIRSFKDGLKSPPPPEEPPKA